MIKRRPLLILHGWSDVAASMAPLAAVLSAQLPHDVQHCALADYLTLDDHVTYDDLVEGFQQAWLAQGLPTERHAVDVVVHSTGGLVIRDWLTRYYTPQTAPIKHLLMLAPANFGSFLAHKGRAFFGRILKGMGHGKPFEVGSELLKGLELGSPYSWDLAMRDCFSEDPFYGPGRTLCTVFVGTDHYHGFAGATHEQDSDGTVRWSCAHLNPVHWSVDLSRDAHIKKLNIRQSTGLTGFSLLPGLNHSTIVGKGKPFAKKHVEKMLQALTVSDDRFSGWCSQLSQETEALFDGETVQGFQNMVVRVHDQYSKPVSDYFLSFTERGQDGHWVSGLFHKHVHCATHVYGDRPAFRSLYLNTQPLREMSDDWDALHINLRALPSLEVEDKKEVVGYMPLDDEHGSVIVVPRAYLSEMMQPHRTLLLDVCLPRVHRQAVFQLKSFESFEDDLVE